MTKKSVVSHIQTGKDGELAAQRNLRQNGYNILDVNWRYQHYEIDIVALKDNILHFVEVKTRHVIGVSTPEDAITPFKSKMLVLASDAYIRCNNLEYEAQIDLAAVDMLPNGEMLVRLITNFVQPRW